MQIIDELETTKRGPYAGVVGYIDFSGNLDTAIAIRTLVAAPTGVPRYRPAPGIVADRTPRPRTRSRGQGGSDPAAVARCPKLSAAHDVDKADV